MISLYKKRDFSDYVTDTIQFFKINWKSYFTHFFVLAGSIILVLAVVYYVFFQAYFGVIFSAKSDSTVIDQFFTQNMGMIAFGGIVLVTLGILLTIILMLYPVQYMRMYEQRGHDEFTTGEIFQEIKNDAGRTLKFFLIMLGLTLTLGIVILAFCILICFTIIGIPVALIILFGLMAVVNMAFVSYIRDRTVGLWQCLRESYMYTRKNLWAVAGSHFIIILLIQLVVSMMTMIPMVYTMFRAATVAEAGSDDAAAGMMAMSGMSIVMVLSYVLSFIFQNAIYVNSGLAYMSMQHDKGHGGMRSEIDQIGMKHED